MALEVRRFAKRPIEEMLETREPQVLAGIISGFKVINGNRGKVGIFTLDDKSAAIEATADETLLTTYRSLLQDDTLVIVSGRLQPGRNGFAARFVVQQVWSLEQARCRFGKYLRVAVSGKMPDVARLVREFPAQREMSEQGEQVRGLSVRLQIQRMVDAASQEAAGCAGAQAELHLGEEARFYPSDAALAEWRAHADQGKAVIAYD